MIGGLSKDSWEPSGILQPFCNPQHCKRLLQVRELPWNPSALCHDARRCLGLRLLVCNPRDLDAMLSINLQSLTGLRSRCNSNWMCQDLGGSRDWLWDWRNGRWLCWELGNCIEIRTGQDSGLQTDRNWGATVWNRTRAAVRGGLKRERNLRLGRGRELQSEGNPRLSVNYEVPWNCTRIDRLSLDFLKRGGLQNDHRIAWMLTDALRCGAIPPGRPTQFLCNSLNWLVIPSRFAIQMQFKLIVPGIPGSCANCAVVPGGLRAVLAVIRGRPRIVRFCGIAPGLINCLWNFLNGMDCA